MNRARVFRSNGEPAAYAHAVVSLQPRPVAPLVELARVEILDPRRTATLRADRPRGAGPRDPGQKQWHAQRPPGVELPDRRPIMRTQRFFIDPELFEQADQEERTRDASGIR